MSKDAGNLICVIGEVDCVLGLKGLGIKVSLVRDIEEAQDSLDEAIREKYQFIYITETYAQELLPWIRELTTGTTICVTIIPGIKEKKNLGFERLRKLSEKGVGVDLISTKV